MEIHGHMVGKHGVFRHLEGKKNLKKAPPAMPE
jgi:hypothetical protein